MDNPEMLKTLDTRHKTQDEDKQNNKAQYVQKLK